MKEKFFNLLKKNYSFIDLATKNKLVINFFSASEKITKKFLKSNELVYKIDTSVFPYVGHWSYKIGMYSANSQCIGPKVILESFYIVVIEKVYDLEINVYICDIEDKNKWLAVEEKKEFSFIGLLLRGTK